jgi:hypothetical protein
MYRPIRLKWYLAAAAMLGLVACSSNATATASPTPNSGSAKAAAPVAAAAPNPSQVDRCTLLTAQEASQMAGVAVVYTQGGGVGYTGPCVYTAGHAVNIAINLYSASDAASAKAYFDAGVQLAQSKGITATVISSLGDSAAAYRTPRAPGAAAIWVLKGAVVLDIGTLIVSGAIPTMDALQAAAKIALGRF